MSENDQTQAVMDRLFGVGEPRTQLEDIARGAVKPGRNAVFSRMLVEAQTLFPNDVVAQNRFAEREADRVDSADRNGHTRGSKPDANGEDLRIHKFWRS